MAADRVHRRYTPEEKGAAIARAMDVGYRVVSKETGIPWGTLSCWVFHARRRAMAADGAPVASGSEAPASAASARSEVAEAASPSSMAPAAPLPSSEAPAKGSRRPRVAKVYTPSQIAQALERVKAIGVRPAASELGISRTTLRAWERKTARAAAGEGVAPTSGPYPESQSDERDARIRAEWKKQVGLGPSQIRSQLRRSGMTVSVQTVRRRRYGA